MLSNTSSPAVRSTGLVLFLLLTVIYLLRVRSDQDYVRVDETPRTDSTKTFPTVAKIAVLSNNASNSHFGPIGSHERYALRHGYPVFIHRSSTRVGPWEEALYFLSVLIQELEKPAADRIDWLMSFNPESVVINPEIPLEIFLPPADFQDIHFLATRSHHTLDIGTFFLRIHPWSVRVMTKVLGSPLLKPDIDTDYGTYETIISNVLNETEHRSNLLYQPRTWYNAYQLQDRFEGRQGDLSVQFSGDEDERRIQLEAWSSTLDGKEGANWQMPLSKTSYPERTSRYWEILRTSRATLELAQAHLKEEDVLAWDDRLAVAVEELESAVHQHADRQEAVENAAERVNELLKETGGHTKASGRKHGLGHHGPTTTHVHEFGEYWRHLVEKEREMRYLVNGREVEGKSHQGEDEDEDFDSPPRGSGGQLALKMQDNARPGQPMAYGGTTAGSSVEAVRPGRRKTYES